ncbi:dTDP-4-dehydrorhamnose 3,5-epimerase [Komagataeibacter swingsii]|uniref:dTDP-4-dehydrorhamnose 3,5-epimerase n=1 Tax=Komagataeibacter swingsii TaxID=215220 RepID=A0A850P7U3_9PROT|nr:dTDP-4-dehydrorhamnose 3,5-epimerase [Komagataeibacter swingsii]AHI24764.1 dTDP-4-dehydrorhamnose 3,5-epimerase [Komagataeibacter xylinus E25]NVN36991.1 dTDP-4-dehydrorhamnose 3,5-epimerase [Komagataeibacter swingsii]RFP01130.1 dTDP-4-dehydrorhamnose 3,5-epimerase [Komagataeibacter xylinus]RFP03978.1 dTDP-4-dehydrorhamnose 3,5-epimerase [Komagataeibacter xylinus]
MEIRTFNIAGMILLTPPRFGDERGYFSETFNAARMKEIGIPGPFVQDNHSLSRQRGVIRGLHCQLSPHAQGKLVRCTRGSIWDVGVDIRTGSPTFGQWVGATLSEENGSQLWIPTGFLHGFCTLSENAEVQYKCTDFWDRDCERSVRWDDPLLAIDWPVAEKDAILSEKDAAALPFSNVDDWFHI